MDHVRVLVVDDDAAVRQSLATALGRDGYEVLAADGGGAALAHMAATSVDAIVLDVAMREPNGLEVCRRLRSRGDRTPILMLTARDLVFVVRFSAVPGDTRSARRGTGLRRSPRPDHYC
jgi:two-component system response regulator MprA